MNDGTIYKSEPYAAPGEASDHIDLKWISDKFLRITGAVVGEKERKEILELLTTADDMPLRDVVAYMNERLVP